MRLMAISGSLRGASTNTSVLKAAARLALPGVEVEIYQGLGSLPQFNPDLDGASLPPEVIELRRQIGMADALLICGPEYARGIAGALKNVFDWLVSGDELPGKPVAVINASQRSVHADASLRLVLETMAARVINSASITLPLLGRSLDAEGIATNPILSEQLREAVTVLVQAAVGDINRLR